MLTGLAALGLAVLASADTLGPVALWAGIVVTGATIGSWNVVAHVTVVSEVPAGHAASASGFVQSAFFLGLGLGAPLFGGLVQFMGGFSVAWGATMLLTFWAFAPASLERHRRRRNGSIRPIQRRALKHGACAFRVEKVLWIQWYAVVFER